jgi:kynurenine formamidase
VSTTNRRDALLVAAAAGIETFDLGRSMFPGMPQSPNHPAYSHTLPRRHGDMVRQDGGSAANDLIITGTHVGTHIDALSHVSHDGAMFGDEDAGEAQIGGRFEALGAHRIAPFVCRGVMLDIPRARGEEVCEPGYEITPADLDGAVDRQEVRPEESDVVLIRTGWGRRFEDGEPFIGRTTGTPGVGAAGARWIADRRVRAAGAETIAFEHVAPDRGHATLPAHRILLIESGIHIIETMDLEALAEAGVGEFLFVLSPLKLVGATGSPVRPLAVVSRG